LRAPLDHVVSLLKGALERVTRALKPKARARRPSSPEPFGSVEDSAGLDALLEPNAVGQPPKAGSHLASIDLREVLADLSRRKALVACLAAALVFLLGLAVTSLVVGAPPKPMVAPPRATREGAALVRRLVVPPRSSLAPRMAMEREGAAPYTARSAVELGLGGADIDLSGISARNDAEADELYGTVRR
jgi:hypothetical protein